MTVRPLLIAALLLSALPARAGGGIVVWRLEAKTGVSEADLDSISGVAATETARWSGRAVVSEADLQSVLRGESLRQQCGVDGSNACLVEIGAALGVPEAVSGDLGRVGRTWVLNLRRVDLRSAGVLGRATRQVEGSLDMLLLAVPAAVAELFGRQAPEPPGMLMIETDPAGARVTIDGAEAGPAPLSRTVPAGPYRIAARLDGYRLGQRTATAAAGRVETVHLALEPLPPSRYRTWGHICFWSGLALAATGGLATWQAAATAGDNASGDWGDRDANRTWSAVAIAGYAAGGAAMAAGVALWLLDPGPDDGLTVGPAMGPGPDGSGIGLRLAGRF